MREFQKVTPAGTARLSSPPPGLTELGKYQLLAVLGRGGMGDVYLAVARGPMDFKKLVVIKRLRDEHRDDEQIRTMFLDEGRLAARLNHPHVVQTYEVGTHEGCPYITMEYLEGQSLSRVQRELSKGAPNPRFAARIISGALSGLHYAHELRDFDGTPLHVVHRDLSPQNIFITYEGVVKLVDFGIAKTTLGAREKTELGVLKGKIAYMSPEQVANEEVDRRADIFAAGLVLWEMLTGQRVMAGKSAAATLNALLNASIPRVSTVVPGIPPSLDDIVAKAVQRHPHERYQTAREMRDALEAYLASSGPAIAEEDIGRFVATSFRRHRERAQQQIQACMRVRPKIDLPAISTISTVSSVVEAEQLHTGSSAGLPKISPSGPPTRVTAVTPPADDSTLSISSMRRPRRGKTLLWVVALCAAAGGGLLYMQRAHPTNETAAAPVQTPKAVAHVDPEPETRSEPAVDPAPVTPAAVVPARQPTISEPSTKTRVPATPVAHKSTSTRAAVSSTASSAPSAAAGSVAHASSTPASAPAPTSTLSAPAPVATNQPSPEPTATSPQSGSSTHRKFRTEL